VNISWIFGKGDVGNSILFYKQILVKAMRAEKMALTRIYKGVSYIPLDITTTKIIVFDFGLDHLIVER
jgi:hypothetical protein